MTKLISFASFKIDEDGAAAGGACAVPVNNVGGGNIAGAGVGPQGEPGVDPKRKKKRLLMDILKRRS